jgi:hypothetical protein
MTCVRLRIGEPDRINPLHACQPLLHEFGALHHLLTDARQLDILHC